MPFVSFDSEPQSPGFVDFDAPVKKDEGSDFTRGVKESFQQLPQLGYGLVAGAGAALESAVGEGGIASGIKKAGVKGYQEWGDKIAKDAKESDSWSYSYDKAKEGDFGALVDWLQHGLGYVGGQGIQALASFGIGSVGGKLAAGTVAKQVAEGMVAKEASKLAAESGGKLAAEAITAQATRNVAEKFASIGANAAVAGMAFGQEGGEIFGDLSQKSVDEHRSLTGAELGKAFATTLAAGGLEFVGDKLGLDVVLGKSALLKPASRMTGLTGRAVRGGIAAAGATPIEAGTEYAQTLLEEAGKGNDPFSPESLKQAKDAAALGALGGTAIGGAGGAIHRPKVDDILAAPDADTAIKAATQILALPAPGTIAPGETMLATETGTAGTAPQFDALRRQALISEAGVFGQGRGSDISDVFPKEPAPIANDPAALLGRQGQGDPLAPMLEDRRIRNDVADQIASEEAARKQAELDAIPQQAAEQNTVRAAVERAGALETPTAMQLALERAKAAPAPDVAVTATNEATAATPLPRVVERTPGMAALPQKLAEQRAAANPSLEVVRFANVDRATGQPNGKFAFSVAPRVEPVAAPTAQAPAVEAPAAQANPQPVAAANPQPVATWFGRRGDGYVSEADARLALPSRQRMEPALSWQIERMPTGKFRLAGYAGETNAPSQVAQQESVQQERGNGNEGGQAAEAGAGDSVLNAEPSAPADRSAPAQEEVAQPVEAPKAIEAVQAPANESDQDRSHREWAENYDRVANAEDITAVSTRDLERAEAYADRRRSNELVKGWGGDKSAVNENFVQALDRELEHMRFELKRRRTAAESRTTAASAPVEAKPAAPAEKSRSDVEKIDDIGEKIGGARKDTAVSTGTKAKRAADERPAWQRRFNVSQIVSGREEGRWVIHDERSKDYLGQARQVGKSFATQEEADAAVPLAAVAMKHRAIAVNDGKYEIWRDINDRKRVKVVDQQFASREDAMKYMAQHAQEIIETNTTFGEADLPVPEDTSRVGPQRRKGDVQGKDFQDAFGFRGVEFGNWNNQDERQQVMNAAYDGLLDMAEVLGIPPKAIGLNGDLALAFGARGQGLNSAKAHYERARAVINLTKMNGAGALAHEWFHALDHYFGRQDGKAAAEWIVNADGTRQFKVNGPESDYASGGFGYKSAVREEVRKAYDAVLQTIFKKGTVYVEDTAKADKFTAVARDDLARELDSLRSELSAQKDERYYKRNNKPASAEQLAEFDTLAKSMIDGDVSALATDWQSIPTSKATIASRWTNDSLEKISAIYKAVRGRSGFDSTNQNGLMDKLQGYMKRYSQRLKMLADAQAGAEKTRMVPTEFAMNAKELDQGRGENYWTTPHEMAARAFQGFVEDKIGEQGGKSPFLNYAPERGGILTPWGVKFPYPRGEERKAINKALASFVGTLQTKETDNGVAMFSQGDEAQQGITKEQFASAMSEAFGPKVAGRLEAAGVVIPLADQSSLPEHVVPFVRDGARVYGFYDPETDRTYAVLGNLTPDMVRGLVLHEVGIHYGFEGMLGKEKYAQVIERVKVLGKAGDRRVIEARDGARRNATPDQKVPEETLARLVQNNPEMGLVREIVASVKAFLFKHFGIGSSSLTVDDLTALAKAAVDHASRTEPGERRPDFARAEPSFSKSVITGLAIPQTWQAPDATKLDNFIYSLQDKHIDTKRVVRSVQDSIGKIADEIDPYLQEELFHGRAAMATKEFLEKEIRPLLTDLQARGIDVSDFEEYLHNRHAERRNVQVAKVNPKMPDGGSGIKTADARAYLANLPADKKRAYEALAKRVEQINKGTRALLVSSGLEKQSTINAWEGAYGDEYVPLMREEMDNGAQGIGQGYSVRGSSSKRAMGSNKPVANILANIALQREKTITRAEKRRVGEAVYGMVLKAPNNDFWFAVDPELQNHKNPNSVMATQMQLISMGLDPADAESIAQEPKTRYVDKATGIVHERINPALRSAENVLAVRIDGEDKFIFFNAADPRAMRMVTALKNLDADQLGAVMGTVAKMTRYFAAVNTQYNPVFGVTNITRDIQTALLNLNSTELKDHKADVMKHILPALRGIYIDLRDHRSGKQPTSAYAAIFEEFQREGGATGYRDMYANAQERADAIADELKQIKQGKAQGVGRAIMGWLSDYNESMENAVRVSAYKVAKEQGMSNQRAASLAKNLTVNFNRKGQVALQAGALYAFFNASVQGTARMAQTMFEGGRLSSAGKKIITGGLLLGVMQALILAAAGFDDGEPPDFVRERSIVIPIGDNKYVSIPMPLGFHIIPNLGRIPAEWAMGGFKNTPKRLAELIGLFADAFNPIGSAGLSMQTLAPTILDPLAALTENKDWTGKPIAKMDFNSLEPTAGHTRAKDTATPWAKMISYGVNIATGGTDYKPGMASPTPDQIDYLIGQVTGGVGREVGKLSQVASGAMSGEEVPLYKVPLVGRFVGTTEGQAAEASRFYENLRQLGEHKAEIDGLKRDRKGAQIGAYVKENHEALLVPLADRIQRDVSRMVKIKRDLVKNDAPRERVKVMDMAITARMKILNDRVRALDKQP